MDLLFSGRQEGETTVQCFLEYQGDTRLALPLLLTVLKEYRELEGEECTTDLERAVLAFRAIDCWPTSYGDDVDYDAVQNYVPKMSEGELDGSGEIYIEDDLDSTGADVEIEVDFDELSADPPVRILKADDAEAEELTQEEASEEDAEVLRALLEKKMLNIEELESLHEALKKYDAMYDGDGGVRVGDMLICPLVETNM